MRSPMTSQSASPDLAGVKGLQVHKELIKHYRKYSPANAQYSAFVRC